MEFKYDEVLDLWVADAEFIGRAIKIRLYCDDDADFGALAAKALNDVESNWPLLKQALAAELLPQYNDNAASEIDEGTLLERLVLKTIDLDTHDIMYTLFWSDSGLFGGHSIQVFWDPEEEFSADVSLVG